MSYPTQPARAEGTGQASVSELQLHQFLEMVPAGAYTCDREGLITYCNQRAVELLGRSPALNDPVDRFCGACKLLDASGAPIAHDQSWMALALKSGPVHNGREIIIERPDGSRVTVMAHAGPLRDASSNVIGAVNLLVETANHNQAAKALRESEQRFHELADNIAQLAWIADGQGSIVWYNNRWFDYTGTTLEEMRSLGWESVLEEECADRVLEKIRRWFAIGEAWEETFTLRSKDGKYRWFLARAVPIRDQFGRVIRWFGTHTDVTVERETAEALRQADRRKDEFLAMLAHELRNPLAPISNSLHILRLAEDVAPSVEKVREIIERQTNLLIRLVDDLLEVSRFTQGKLDLRREPIDLAAVIRSAVETSRPQLEARRHQLAITVAPGPIAVDADPVRLAQVFGNLLNNAAKFTPEGGQIWLSARLEDGQAVISVRDNGVGIAAEQLPRVFDLFTQVTAPQARPLGGLGIGLSLAKNLVQMHGGTIEAHSPGPGKGSEFTVRLPLVADTAFQTARLVAPHSVASSAVPRRVLVVDDSRDCGLVLGKLLETLGHQVMVAGNATSALDLARSHRPDVVISDIAMVGMDGYELARRLRGAPETQGIVLIALTGYGQENDRLCTQEAGFDHHLVKPVSMDMLERLFELVPARQRIPSG